MRLCPSRLGLTSVRHGCLPALVIASLLLSAPAVSAQEPRRIPRREPEKSAAIQGAVQDLAGRPLSGVLVGLRRVSAGSGQWAANTDGDGIFRLTALTPGAFELKLSRAGYRDYERTFLNLSAGESVVIAVTMEPVPGAGPAPEGRTRPQDMTGPPAPLPESERDREIERRTQAPPVEAPRALTVVRDGKVFVEAENRWAYPEPEWNRYGQKGEYPYVKGKPLDPFNRNKWKGDYALFGRTFLNVLLTSDTLANGRRLPVPSNVSAARPRSEEFFGRGEQFFVNQTFRLTADLFQGDTAFRPFDWRVRVTPGINLNYLRTRENGIVNIDVRRGTNRLDWHAGLQEAFVEAKVQDLSRNYDFASVRAGIQPFSSDFRGFVFFDEQPGLRVFGNFFNNRWEYNAAYFYLLEKDTNSVLNKLEWRRQQVAVANLYVQDFLVRGYTTQFSVHLNRDDGRRHFDDNNFLVRPAPIGLIASRRLDSGYLGWTGSGHFGRVNVSHAFYQALGEDRANPLAGRPVTINAQMAAAELSVDKDWLRFKGSFFYASGDAHPRDGRARGFDSIVDSPVFAGGIFSLWNSQGIRLAGTGVGLVSPNSLLPNLRSNKEEGKSNFVNPGLWLYNLGMDAELTTKLRALINVNYLRFDRTEPLELLLFQAPIRHEIGLDYSLGLQYRPPLSDNIILTFGGGALSPGRGFGAIYTRRTLFSAFSNVRLQF